MTEWREVALGEGIDILHGFAFKGEYFRDDGDLIVLTPGNFWDEGGFKPKSGKEKYYDGPVPPRFLLSHGDVIVAMTEQVRGLLGSSATVPTDGVYLHNQRIGLVQVTDPETFDLRFVYHLMNTSTVRQQIQATATGSKVRHTAPERIKAVRVSIPDTAVQRWLAWILDSIDALIENNRRRAEVLEEMARAIYREWFVSFRYPGHEDVPLVDSPLGPIPEGWRCCRLDEVAMLVRGRSYRKRELVTSGGLPFVNLKCMMRGGGFRRDGLKRYDGKVADAQLVGHGDVVLAVTDLTQGREILARATLIPRLPESRGVISLDVARIVPSADSERLWIFAALRWSDFPDRVKEYANGSTVLHLSPDHVAAGLVLWPPDGLRAAFITALTPMMAAVDELADGSDQLTSMRDLLLPRLVTGQIDVSHIDLDDLPEAATA